MAFPQFPPLTLVLAATAALHGALLVTAQTTHTVKVGLQGSFFDPATISAGLNDTITFIFAGFFHTVTQSSFANPCSPLPGGFSSGPAGTQNNDTQHPMTWDLHITNVSEPIWFFCEMTQPTSHCAVSGMVGRYISVINPPSIAAYTSFRAAAQQVTGTPQPNFQIALTGIGAFATQTPAIPSTPVSIPPSTPTPSDSSTSSSTTSSSTTSPSDTSTAAAAHSSSSSHLGAIVGGAVGGAAVLILGLILILWLLRVQKSRRTGPPGAPDSPTSDDANFFRYNPAPVRRRPSEAFAEAKQLEAARSLSATRQATPTPAPASAPSMSMSMSMSPNRRGEVVQQPQFPPGVPRTLMVEPHMLDRQTSFGSTAMSFTGNSSAGAASVDHHQQMQQTANLNIHALASEVAGILRQPANTAPVAAHPTQEGTPRSIRKLASDSSRFGAESIHRTESPLSPPAYRTTVVSQQTLPDTRPHT
ncbi:hypothetical protein JR316_0010479 [Psilocybe cubensis]|uniref:Uncharacterized protein n=2 Tax=Psilocybe cubensis TaxID=181762 RepID=A0A8H7XJT5_PSICU|nr:hypothetical protein JR316_0010479 [Psilocybe cubensis]KAH9476567.1 hypothetical protein JR316_0010479 [Psilocybe cubensis]